MKKIIEVFHMRPTENGMEAFVLLKEDNPKPDDLNNGYSFEIVPVNIRPLQLSVRDNLLVDQSAKEDPSDSKPLINFPPSNLS